MRQKLYGNHVESACEVCQFGRRSADGRAVLCARKGVVPLYYHCRKFRYDPLKRVPPRRPKRTIHTAEEFKLD